MYRIQKLKPDRNFNGLLIPFAAMVVAALFGVLFDLEAALYFAGVFFSMYALYTFLTYIRTRNPGFIVISLYQVTLATMAFLMPSRIGGPRDPEIIFLLFLILFFLVWLAILLFTKKIKWRGREILEIAAEPVEDTGSGYTTRPMPAGKTDYTRKQIIQFAQFVRRHLIAVPYIGKEKLVFVPVISGREFPFIVGLKRDYTDETWIAFDFNGNVTVNISHRDYLNYNETLSFNQLCESLGNTFVEFMELFLRGEGSRVVDRMNNVGISPFS